MPSTHGALVVFGSGPGVGRSVAAVFAERGYEKVIVMSRNAERLKQDADVVRSANLKTGVDEISVDIGNPEQVQESLKKVDAALGDTPLETVLFNAARTAPSKFFDFSPQELETDLKIAIIGLYAVAQWAVPKLEESAASGDKTPALLTTSGMLAKDPFPAMFSLASCKAGQYSLVHSLHKEFEPKGVHVGIIIIGGSVSDDSKVTNARNIAEEIWNMSRVEQKKGHLELMLSDPAYEEHIKTREKRK
ncbi:hypothetical protein M409DRAFT_16551 [Zasmidium cellare ATCC 36951]|uniref:Ketoreductase (KR) domain-containing protein n=1 Tax=Zasmidium cellare ATCC 36951 TaxID=1080233 RepID=A0A6A6D767_ZASCE|nr:uncharacterized protein M409DRAFT_16551 [Zasmidium cellare ATCC 36951]KAF2174288.1 hypothetical protein M409DRAFT_16551 [Zasmidium cellare ATCC 36951]